MGEVGVPDGGGPPLPPTPVRPSPTAERTQVVPRGIGAETVAMPHRDLQAHSLPACFGRYVILGEIARGGMGVVYRARQTDLGRTVALKVLLSGTGASETEERRFLREVEAAAQLRHPHIVAVHDVGTVEGRRFFTMDLVEGRNLVDWAHGRDLCARVRLMAQVCRAVHHAHMQGIIHRDLKPGNLLVTADDEPRVLDFGLAKFVTPEGACSALTVSGEVMGTPQYMSPEQAAGGTGALDIRSDVFSLGIILYEVIAGLPPFRAEAAVATLLQILETEPPPLDAPSDLQLVVRRALEKDKSRRYPTAETLADDLERFLAGESVQARPPTLRYLLRRKLRRHPAAFSAAAVAAALLAAVTIWLQLRPGEIAVAVDVPGAWVELDGKVVVPPIASSAGRHRLRVWAPGFEESTREVDVLPGEHRSTEVSLSRSTGLLTLDSDEVGSTVELLGETHGTPVTRHALAVGEYRARVRRRGHESREAGFAIRRGEHTQVFVALPASRYWFAPVADGTGARMWLRDVNGDGVPDVSTAIYYHLWTYDGRTGAVLRRTPIDEPVFYHAMSLMDVDGDRVLDDVTTHRTTSQPPTVLVQAWSGRECADGSVQRRLWQRRYPCSPDTGAPAPARAGAGLWLPVPAGLERVEGATGAALQTIDLPAPPTLAAIEGSADVVAVTGTIALRLGPAGEVRWRADLPGNAAAVADPWGSPVPVMENVVPLREAGAVSALDVRSGAPLWRAPAPGADFAVLIAPPAGGASGVLVVVAREAVVGHDLPTGTEVLRLAPGPADVDRARITTAPGLLLTPAGSGLEGRAARGGEVRWRAELPGKPACPAAWNAASGGIEIHVATDRALLLTLDERGRLLRELSLRCPPLSIQPCTIDADGKSDLILMGYGIQCVPSSRVRWRRTLTNAVRPRPLAFSIDGRPVLVLPGTWEDGSQELRCLDAATGQVVWRHGSGLDVIYEPALEDVNGDGTPDVGLVFQGAQSGLHLLSGRDGAVLELWPDCGTTYGRGVVLDLDGDRRPDVVVPTWDRGLRAYVRGKAEPLWTLAMGTVLSAPAAVDLDGDGRDELLVAFGNSTSAMGWVVAVNGSGQGVWACDLLEYVRSTPGWEDVDGDGAKEVLIAGARDLHVLDSTGGSKARWSGMGGGMFPPLRVSLPEDGGGSAFLLGGAAGVFLVHGDGSPVWRYPCAAVLGALGLASLPGAERPRVVGVDVAGRLFVLDLATGGELWRWETGALCEGGVTLADVDGDGVPEAVLGLHDGSLQVMDLK